MTHIKLPYWNFDSLCLNLTKLWLAPRLCPTRTWDICPPSLAAKPKNYAFSSSVKKTSKVCFLWYSKHTCCCSITIFTSSLFFMSILCLLQIMKYLSDCLTQLLIHMLRMDVSGNTSVNGPLLVKISLPVV